MFLYQMGIERQRSAVAITRRPASSRERYAHTQHAHLYVGNTRKAAYTGAKGGSCGNDIIYEKQVAACVGKSPHQFKGVVNIVGALPPVFMGLRFGIYDAANKLSFHFQTCNLGDALRQHFTLIITSLPHPLSC